MARDPADVDVSVRVVLSPSVYTESLFLLLSVGAFYAMRRGRLGWVAVCGLAAGLTRPNGFWLALPLACLALWPPSSAAGSSRAGRSRLPTCAAGRAACRSSA